MSSQREELTPIALQTTSDTMLSEAFDKVNVTEFFGMLAAMGEEEPETIELMGHIENGQLTLDTPTPLPVEGNTINVGNKRIIIKLHDAA